MILHWIKQAWWSAWSAWERLSVRICGGLATGRASQGRICRLARARQFWQEQESCRNPEESRGIRWKYRNSCPAGNPAKKFCKSGWKQEFSRPLHNHVPVNKFLWKKTEKRNPQESCFFLFSVQKINACQTGITNLASLETPSPLPLSIFWWVS